MLRLLLALALLACVLAPTSARANSRDLKWRTITTEHFYIHYYQGSEAAAERAAMLLERAHERLSVGYGHETWLRTHVTMTDTTDTANGSANANPYPRISANITAPDSMSVLESYDDWFDILLTHEYTHVLHLDTIHGIPRIVNAALGFGVLGKVWAPNIIQPRWMVEGIASVEESRLTSQGRHRSAQFDMMLRMAVLEHGFQPIDRVSSGANLFPHGTSVYLYGLHFMHYLHAHYGHDKLRELSHLYGGQAIPYRIHIAIEKVLGVSWDQLWQEFELETTRRFEAQARQIRARGVREGRRLTYSTANQASGQFTRHPFWSNDDEWIYFYEDDGHSNPGIRRIRSTGGRVREGVGVGRQGMNVDLQRVFEVQSSASGSFVLGTQDMVFEIALRHDFRYDYNDLFLWRGPNPSDLEQLTFGERARDPNVSPDGRTVVFSRNDDAQSRLAFLDLHTRKIVEVAPADDRISQVFSPRWAPDSRRVAYSGWREGGWRDIYVYDRASQTTRRITADRFIDTEPCWTPDGQYVLFSSDRDDVFNIYAYEVETGALRQVTNVIGGAFEPVVSNDGRRMTYIGFSAQGYDLWTMKLDPAEFFAPLPVIDDLPAVDDPTPELAADAGRSPTRRSRRYQPIRTLYPRSLLPTVMDLTASGFGTEIGGTLAVSDVLGFHALTGSARYSTAFGAPTGSVAYRFSQLLPSFSLGFGRSYARRTGFSRYVYDNTDPSGGQGGYFVRGYTERITQLRAGVEVPVIRHPIHSADASLDYSYTQYTNVDQENFVDPNAPTSSLPEVGGLGQVDLALAYDNRRTVRYAYYDETGRAAGVRLTIIDPHLGGRFSDLQVGANYTEMLRMPWRGHQVLALRVGAGASAGGLGRRPAYYIGGNEQQNDVVRGLLQRTATREAGVLRGFQPLAFDGRYYTVLNVEYRIPLADVERGLGTLPLFMRRVTAIPFTDIGGAWTSGFTRKAFHVGVGAALVLSFKMGYAEAIDLFIQYAHGFDEEFGLDTFRAAVNRSF
ncbi:MAG: PD40 domain-containing protein [Myxococcales bacterium]|nr:PD40 domain-containing protein [Myxococcales bacterium]